MKVYNKIDDRIKNSILKEYGESFIFVHHTGSMYGIGGLAGNQESIERIKQFKGRFDQRGFIVLIPSLLSDDDTGNHPFSKSLFKVSPRQIMLMEQYWCGNLTICLELSKQKNSISKLYEGLSVDNKVALRCPQDDLTRDFINYFQTPVISTSINRTGEKPLNDFAEISAVTEFDFALLKQDVIENSTAESAFSTIIDFKGEDIVCLREGSIPFDSIKQSYERPLITFICTANICRSPMAEYYAKHIFTRRNLPFRAASAGVFASGNRISPNSELSLKEDGIESRCHLSKQVGKKLIENSYLVLTMEKVHKDIIFNLFPTMKHKVFTIAEYCMAEQDVADPYTQDKVIYEDTYSLIKKYVDIIADKLDMKLQS